ncbi:MAG: pectinesterase family protein [Paludibacteraceae bacterium]
MNLTLFILSLVLHVHAGETINDALDSARAVYASRGEQTTILIEPGTYREELTIDIPGLRLINAAKRPSIALRNGGVDCDKNAVRLTWYYGHGYQYQSMGNTVNYGGSRTRLWNASVLVTAPDFYAENIIFENSFNLYVCDREAADSLIDISQSDMPWTDKERPKKIMPLRPKDIGSTEVQKKKYRERAAAISFASSAKNAHLKNCRAVGRQDVLYGDQGASIYWERGILAGGVDFIFGGMAMSINKATIVANINGEKGDKCYISAGRKNPTPPLPSREGEKGESNRGLLFYKCHIRLATEDELVNRSVSPKDGLSGAAGQYSEVNLAAVYLARPWRWWGETVWAYTTWDEGILNPEGWHTGLVKNKEGFNPENPCPYSYEYRSQDNSVGRPKWVSVLRKPILPDGTRLNPKTWLK